MSKPNFIVRTVLWLAEEWSRASWVYVGASVIVQIISRLNGHPLILEVAAEALLLGAAYCWGAEHVTRQQRAEEGYKRKMEFAIRERASRLAAESRWGK